MFWKRYIIAKYVSECLISTFALEGCSAEKHFIDQYTERPPIHRAGMTATFNYLWCNVFFCADERVGSEVCYAGFGVDCRQGIWSCTVAANDHFWSTVRT